MPDRKFVIDTSLFVNPHAREKFGKDPTEAVRGFIKAAEGVDARFYMPPVIFGELKNFVKSEAMEDLELMLHKRAPNVHGIFLPAAIFYEFVEDMRERINKGLRLAEDFAKDNRPDNDEKLRRLREKYREVMRTEIIDSKEDFELVLLARELDATLVSSDEGAIKFANQVGCSWINASKFHSVLARMK